MIVCENMEKTITPSMYLLIYDYMLMLTFLFFVQGHVGI